MSGLKRNKTDTTTTTTITKTTTATASQNEKCLQKYIFFAKSCFFST